MKYLILSDNSSSGSGSGQASKCIMSIPTEDQNSKIGVFKQFCRIRAVITRIQPHIHLNIIRVLEKGTSNVHRIRDIRVSKKAPLHESPDEPLSSALDDSPTTSNINKTTIEEEEEEAPPTGPTEPVSENADDWSGARDVGEELGVSSDLNLLDTPTERTPTAVDARTTNKTTKDSERKNEGRRYNLRNRAKLKPPDRYVIGSTCEALSSTTTNQTNTGLHEEEEVPNNVKEVNKSRYRNEWWSAMMEEMESFQAHKVYRLEKPIPGQRVLTNRWIFSLKKDKDGRILKRKARLVVRGCHQRPGIDYTELFSPTARFETIRTVLAISAKEHLHLYQFDVKTAFLSAELDRKLVMRQPEGFDDNSGRVCILDKAVYGTVQAPRAFNQKMNRTLLGMKSVSLRQSDADPCLYISKPPKRVLVLIYVDDAIVSADNEQTIKEFLRELGKTFELTSKPLDYFLGLRVNISKNRGRINLDQSKYIREVLERFQMSNCKASPVPIDNTSKSAYEGETDVNLEYRQVVGALMYCAICTRPDISYSVSFLSRYLDRPTRHLWSAAMKVLRYLKATESYGPVYTDTGGVEVRAYSDADFAGCNSTRRSTSGAIISFGGGALVWVSHRQGAVTLSSLESELVASCETARNCLWLMRMLREAGYATTPTLLVDNSACIHLINNAQVSKRSKHIETKNFFVREKVESGEFKLQHCPTEINLADLCTKALPRTRFEKLRTLIGIVKDVNSRCADDGSTGQ